MGGYSLEGPGFKVFSIGLEPSVERFLYSQQGMESMTEILPAKFADLIENPLEKAPDLVICGPLAREPSPLEVAQVFRQLYKSMPILFICEKLSDLNPPVLAKNGITTSYIMNRDFGRLRRDIRRALYKHLSTNSHIEVAFTLNGPEDTVPYDIWVFLPQKKTYFCAAPGGAKVRPDLYSKLEEDKLPVFIDSSQLETYITDTLMRMKDPNKAPTPRLKKIAARYLGFYLTPSKQASRDLLDDLIMRLAVTSVTEMTYSQITTLLHDSQPLASFTENVTVLAVLLSLLTQIGSIKDIALASLLHDIGILTLPKPEQKTDFRRIAQANLDNYKKHVQASLDKIKQAKIEISPVAQKAILGHHENFDGSGYPQAAKGTAIPKEASILAMADFLAVGTWEEFLINFGPNNKVKGVDPTLVAGHEGPL